MRPELRAEDIALFLCNYAIYIRMYLYLPSWMFLLP